MAKPARIPAGAAAAAAAAAVAASPTDGDAAGTTVPCEAAASAVAPAATGRETAGEFLLPWLVEAAASSGWPAPLLRHEGLELIKGRKHVPGTMSPLDKALQPAWDSLVKFLPTWLAPNCVTLLGLAPTLLAYCFMCASCPDFDPSVPPWQFVFFAFASVVYFIMDNLDGKQARRTGSSSPLGHLFDHGVDTLVILPYHAFVIVGGLGLGPTRLTIVTQLIVQTSFFLAQWQERYTAVCPNAGISEMCLISSLISFVAGVTETLSEGSLVALRHREVFMGMDFRGVLLNGMLINGVAYLLFFIISTSRVAVKQGRFHGALMELVPALMLCVSAACWRQEALARNTLCISVLTGLLFFFCTVQFILFSMAGQDFSPIQPAVALYSGLAVLSRFVDEKTLRPVLLGTTLYFGISLAFWTLNVIVQIKVHLGIHALSLKPVQREPTQPLSK